MSRLLFQGSRCRRAPVATLAAALSVAVLGIALAACSSTASSTTTTSTTSPPPSSSSSTSSSSTTTLPTAASAKSAIEKAYMTLFDLANPAVAPKLASVQDGTQLKAAFEAALKSSLAKAAGGARVSSVTVESGSKCSAESLPSPCAEVTYDVLSPSGQALLTNSKGFATESSGHWLVAKTTICTLLVLDNGGKTPPGC